MDHLKLPKIDFYQLAVRYTEEQTEEHAPEKYIPAAADGAKTDSAVIYTTDFSMKTTAIEEDSAERGKEHAGFDAWLYGIVKGSFGTLTMYELAPYRSLLRTLFDTITYETNGSRTFSSRYNRAIVEANIRKAFAEKRSFRTTEEVIPQEASLLNIANFTEKIYTEKPKDYYPEQTLVEKIHLDDEGKLKPDKATAQMLAYAEENGMTDVVEMLRKKITSHPQKDRSFHYLPYHTDSGFEQTFLSEVLAFPQLEQLGLEVYYNGDRAMTEFKIKCFKNNGDKWQYIGMYTPDFLILQRRDGAIYKAIIVETKGEAFVDKFKDKSRFMETAFLRENNRKFGYERFEYLYLEDTMSEHDRIVKAQEKIKAFFGGE
jgi:hypothetical protein